MKYVTKIREPDDQCLSQHLAPPLSLQKGLEKPPRLPGTCGRAQGWWGLYHAGGQVLPALATLSCRWCTPAQAQIHCATLGRTLTQLLPPYRGQNSHSRSQRGNKYQWHTLEPSPSPHPGKGVTFYANILSGKKETKNLACLAQPPPALQLPNSSCSPCPCEFQKPEVVPLATERAGQCLQLQSDVSASQSGCKSEATLSNQPYCNKAGILISPLTRVFHSPHSKLERVHRSKET